MKHARRPFHPVVPTPRLNVRGSTAKFINYLESEAREKKKELARMRADFITYLYEHSEPI